MKINPKKIIEAGYVKPTPGAPPLCLEGDNCQLQQSGIDLRLARAEKVVGTAELYNDKSKDVRPTYTEMQIVENCFLFQPGEQYSLTFMEDVEIPGDMCASIIHRSTINRGIGTIFSALFDGGFKSKGGCGATFRPLVSTKIEIGTRLAQIIFEDADTASLYNGQYQAK